MLQVRGQLTGALTQLTSQTICDPAVLARELRRIKMSGIALDNEESMNGRRCLAAPVYDGLGQCVAAVSLTSTPGQMTDQAIARLSTTLTATVKQITRIVIAYEMRTPDEVLCV